MEVAMATHEACVRCVVLGKNHAFAVCVEAGPKLNFQSCAPEFARLLQDEMLSGLET